MSDNGSGSTKRPAAYDEDLAPPRKRVNNEISHASDANVPSVLFGSSPPVQLRLNAKLADGNTGSARGGLPFPNPARFNIASGVPYVPKRTGNNNDEIRRDNTSNATAGVLDLNKAAITPFPNEARLKHPSLATVDWQVSQLCAEDSAFAKTNKKYNDILQPALDHESEVKSLLQSAKASGQVDMAADLELKLIDASERRAKAEHVLDDLNDVAGDLARISEQILELDTHVVDTIKKLNALCGNEIEE